MEKFETCPKCKEKTVIVNPLDSRMTFDCTGEKCHYFGMVYLTEIFMPELLKRWKAKEREKKCKNTDSSNSENKSSGV